MAEDFVATQVAPDQGAAFTIGGLLSKAAETGLEAFRNRIESGSNKQVGTAFVTGQTNPERVDAVQPTESTAVRAQQAFVYLPYIVGGGVIVAIALAALSLRRGR